MAAIADRLARENSPECPGVTTHPRDCGRSPAHGPIAVLSAPLARPYGFTFEGVARRVTNCWRRRGTAGCFTGPLRYVKSFTQTTDSGSGAAETALTTCATPMACGRAPDTDRIFRGILMLSRSKLALFSRARPAGSIAIAIARLIRTGSALFRDRTSRIIGLASSPTFHAIHDAWSFPEPTRFVDLPELNPLAPVKNLERIISINFEKKPSETANLCR